MKFQKYQATAMNSYETSATVEDQGQIRMAGVPFAPGTEVHEGLYDRGEK